MPEEMVQTDLDLKAFDLIRKHGTIRESARRSGVPRATLQGRLYRHLKTIGVKPSDFLSRNPHDLAGREKSAYQLVLEHGGIAPAARASGIPPTTIRGRVASHARKTGQVPPTPPMSENATAAAIEKDISLDETSRGVPSLPGAGRLCIAATWGGEPLPAYVRAEQHGCP